MKWHGAAFAFLLWVLALTLSVVALYPLVRQVCVTVVNKVGWGQAATYLNDSDAA